jgi:hypothetical protein
LHVEGVEALQVPKLVVVGFAEAIVELVVREVEVGAGVLDMAARLDM